MKTSSGVSAACLPAYFEALDAFRSNAIDLVQIYYIEGFMPSFELTYQLAYHQVRTFLDLKDITTGKGWKMKLATWAPKGVVRLDLGKAVRYSERKN